MEIFFWFNVSSKYSTSKPLDIDPCTIKWFADHRLRSAVLDFFFGGGGGGQGTVAPPCLIGRRRRRRRLRISIDGSRWLPPTLCQHDATRPFVGTIVALLADAVWCVPFQSRIRRHHSKTNGPFCAPMSNRFTPSISICFCFTHRLCTLPQKWFQTWKTKKNPSFFFVVSIVSTDVLLPTRQPAALFWDNRPLIDWRSFDAPSPLPPPPPPPPLPRIDATRPALCVLSPTDCRLPWDIDTPPPSAPSLTRLVYKVSHSFFFYIQTDWFFKNAQRIDRELCKYARIA